LYRLRIGERPDDPEPFERNVIRSRNFIMNPRVIDGPVAIPFSTLRRVDPIVWLDMQPNVLRDRAKVGPRLRDNQMQTRAIECDANHKRSGNGGKHANRAMRNPPEKCEADHLEKDGTGNEKGRQSRAVKGISMSRGGENRQHDRP